MTHQMVFVCRKTHDWKKRRGPDCEPYCAYTVHIEEAPRLLIRTGMTVDSDGVGWNGKRKG